MLSRLSSRPLSIGPSHWRVSSNHASAWLLFALCRQKIATGDATTISAIHEDNINRKEEGGSGWKWAEVGGSGWKWVEVGGSRPSRGVIIITVTAMPPTWIQFTFHVVNNSNNEIEFLVRAAAAATGSDGSAASGRRWRRGLNFPRFGSRHQRYEVSHATFPRHSPLQRAPMPPTPSLDESRRRRFHLDPIINRQSDAT